MVKKSSKRTNARKEKCFAFQNSTTSRGRADFIWKPCRIYTQSFRFLPQLPFYLDVNTNRISILKSVPNLLLWFILAYIGTGGINCLSKILQFLYVFVIPETLSGRTQEDYNEFGSIVQVASICMVILSSGATPVIGLFFALFGKMGTRVINQILDIEDKLEKRKSFESNKSALSATCSSAFYLYLFITLGWRKRDRGLFEVKWNQRLGGWGLQSASYTVIILTPIVVGYGCFKNTDPLYFTLKIIVGVNLNK